jgi:sortase B
MAALLNTAKIAITVALAAVVAVNSHRLYEMSKVYQAEEKSHERLMAFSPRLAAEAPNSELPAEQAESQIATTEALNQSIVDLQSVNSDIVGWLTIDGTAIDYPFAQSQDNAFYLGNDVYKTPAKAGSAFMDYRCDPGFSGPNSVIYGHNMKNGTMFADILKFEDEAFFDDHPSGLLYLSDATYEFEVFAFLVTSAIDWPMFLETEPNSNNSFLSYAKSHAKRWRDVDLKPEDRLVTLSTCSYEFKDARAAIVGKLAKIGA